MNLFRNLSTSSLSKLVPATMLSRTCEPLMVCRLLESRRAALLGSGCVKAAAPNAGVAMLGYRVMEGFATRCKILFSGSDVFRQRGKETQTTGQK